MDTYKMAVRSERNIQPLSDDYIKFMRLAQDRIERTEQGMVAIITNHAYLSGLIHRGMREALMKTFTEIYVLNLHGNATIGESAPDGSVDQNVFDIRQGVAIALFIKQKKANGLAKVNFFELWGRREEKYKFLHDNDVSTTDWQSLTPHEPYFFFVLKNFDLQEEYNNLSALADIFSSNKNGIQTGHDKFAIDIEKDRLQKRLTEFFDAKISTESISQTYSLKDKAGWNLTYQRSKGFDKGVQNNLLVTYFYRPFDFRWIYYDKSVIKRPVYELMPHLLRPNLSLVTCRQQVKIGFHHSFVTKNIGDGNAISLKSREWNYYFPLYLYPTERSRQQGTMFDAADLSAWPPDEHHGGRVPNLNPDFVDDLAQKLGLTFTPHPTGDLQTSFGPEDIFHYIYAVFHSPTYRSRYAEFLKIDFPRVPLTRDVNLFRALCGLGKKLVALHLLESPQVGHFSTRYPVAGHNEVAKGYPKYVAPNAGQPGRIRINNLQYFEGIPPHVWEFQVGGYQVLHKWLKDRRGRQLSYDDLTHYQQIVVALQQTMDLMTEIDQTIPEWPFPS